MNTAPSPLEDQLRAMLRRHAGEPAPRGDAGEVRRRVQRRRRRRQLVPAVGAVAVISAGIVGFSVASDDGHTTTAADGAPESPSGVPFPPRGDAAPYVELPGWQVTYYVEFRYVGSALQPGAVVSDDERRATISVAPSDGAYVIDATARPVEIAGATAAVGTLADGRVAVVWSRPGATFVLESTGLTEDDAVFIARGVVIDESLKVTAVDNVPAGMSVELLADRPEVQTDSEYQWARDGQRMQLHFYAGGRATYDMRVGGEARSDVEVFGLPASLLDYGNGRYRVDVLVGDYTLEFDGEPFASAEDFLASIGEARPTDVPPPAEVTAPTVEADGAVNAAPVPGGGPPPASIEADAAAEASTGADLAPPPPGTGDVTASTVPAGK